MHFSIRKFKKEINKKNRKKEEKNYLSPWLSVPIYAHMHLLAFKLCN